VGAGGGETLTAEATESVRTLLELNLYRDAVPHDGFAILRRRGERMPLRSFVFTSNVAGQFQTASRAW
jgi:hypothetical protein